MIRTARNHLSDLKKQLFGQSTARALFSIIVFVLIWELGSKSKDWFGFVTPWLGHVPAPTDVIKVWIGLLTDSSYWQSWVMSFLRVLAGFVTAMVLGIPFGLAIAVSRISYGIIFPSFEVLRPIPPLAWVPAAIIFWPTQELSIIFVTFLGAFYTIVINVLGGARAIDLRYFQVAESMGASKWDVFRRIILPGTLPSIMVGAAVGMGLTWEVVVAAEMISGGGGAVGSSGGGLGFFIWNSYVGGSYEQIIVGMISIGIAGFISSAGLRKLGELCTPWLRKR